jgi:N-acetylneuraminic acid mutarotase
MPTARGALAVGAIGGKLYAAGGMTSGRPLGKAVRALEVYDIATDRWSRGPDMPAAREHVGGTVLDGRFYVLGGRDPRSDALGTATRFDPESGEWESLPPLRVAAGGLEAVTDGGAVLALGGGDDRGGTVTGAVQRYEPSQDRWRVVSRMRTPRHGFAATVVGSRIYTFGGSPCALFAASKFAESYDPGATG